MHSRTKVSFAAVVAATALLASACSNQATQNAVNDPASSSAQAGSTLYVDAANKCANLTPCFTTLQDALEKTNPDAADTIEVFDGDYKIKAPANPTDPAINITHALTITSYDEDGSGDDCPQIASSCPVFTVEGPVNIPVQISANDVSVNNITITQKDVPGSNPVAAIIYVPQNPSGPLYSGIQLTELALVGARRGIWLSGSNSVISSSVFSNQARDSIFVPATAESLTIQNNDFSAGAAKAVLFESQYGSPASKGDIRVAYNTLYGKGNFLVWNSWADGYATNSVDLSVDHNTIVNTSGAAVAVLPNSPSPGFGMFSRIDFTNNIVTGAGGDAFYLDYQYSPTPSALPAAGQINVTNSLTFNNKESAGTNDPTGNYGFSKGAPEGTSIAAFDLTSSTNIANQDPQIVDPAGGDFSLASKSPAIGAGTNKSNIGQWQGNAPTVLGVKLNCAAPGATVRVSVRNVDKDATVTFGDAKAEVTAFKGGKKKKKLTVIVPPGAAGSFVDVSVTSDGAVGTLLNGFHYSSGAKGGC